MKDTQRTQCTKNYNLFTVSPDNRAVELGRRKDLRKSMELYGFLPGFPILCRRVNGKLVIIDGQHRFGIAQELGLPVWYSVEDRAVDVAIINASQRGWNVADYVNRHAVAGNKHYVELIEFAALHHMPLSFAAGALFGHCNSQNVMVSLKDGTYKIRDWEYASRVAIIFGAVRNANKECATSHALFAISALCRIEGIDDQRMIKAIAKRADMLRRFNNRDACLSMFEAIYNDGLNSKNRRALAFEAHQALDARNSVRKNKNKD